MFIFIRLLSDDYGRIAFLYRDYMYISKIVVQARNDKLNNAQYSFFEFLFALHSFYPTAFGRF